MPKPKTRSPYKPWPVITGDAEMRMGRCFPCERYMGVELPPRALIHIPEPVQVGPVTLEPGWYCKECLQRAKRPEPPEKF